MSQIQLDPDWLTWVNAGVRKIHNMRGPGVNNKPDSLTIDKPRISTSRKGGDGDSGTDSKGTKKGQIHQMLTDNGDGWDFPLIHG